MPTARQIKGRRAGDVFLPDRLLPKLRKLWAYKKRRGEGVGLGDPLFANQSKKRISKRRVQYAWRAWQKKAGLNRLHSFHSRRHSAVSAV